MHLKNIKRESLLVFKQSMGADPFSFLIFRGVHGQHG